MTLSAPSIAEEGGSGSLISAGTPLSWVAEVLRRRTRIVVIVTALILLIVIGIGLLLPLRYTASAYILLDSRQQNATGSTPVLANLQIDSAATDSQVQVLKSRQMIQRVVERLQLQNVPEFSRPPAAGLGFRRWLGLDILPPDAEAATAQAHAIDNLTQKVSVGSLGLSSVLQVSADSHSPTMAAQIANAFAQSYLDDQLSQKSDANTRAVGFLASRLDELRRNAETSDAALHQYEVAHHIVGLQSATGATANQQEIQSLTAELSTARGAQAEADAKMGAMGGGTDAINSDDGARSPVIQDLKKQRSLAAADLAKANTRYGPMNSEVIALNETVANLDRAILTEAHTIRGTAQTGARAARARTAQIAANLASAEGSLQQASIASVGANQLRNRADSDRAIYLSFLDRYKQTAAQSGFETPDARIISAANPPTKPSSISLKILALVGALGGLALGIVTAIVVELLWGCVYREDQIRQDFGIASLGILPELSSTLEVNEHTSTPVIDFPQTRPLSVLAEMVRGIGGTAAFDAVPPHHIVTITSALPGEGKSTCSITIARMLAQSGLRTLLVDGDLIARSTTKQLGGATVGLSELVAGAVTWDQAVIQDPLTTLQWIGISDNSRHDALFGTIAVDPVLAMLRAQYDIVVIDSAPILATADARALAMKADRVVLAVRWSTTRRRAVLSALKLMRSLEIRPSGAILTRVDMRRQARMGDADTYDYYKQYRDYAQRAGA